MAWVTQQFIDVWKSGRQIGANTPQAVVQIQRGMWSWGFNPWYGPSVQADIWGEPMSPASSLWASRFVTGPGVGGYWFPQWQAHSAWVDVPGVLAIKRTKDLSQNGVTVLEVTMDALDFVEEIGSAGDLYHAIVAGYNAPYRGFVPAGRPDPQWSASDMDEMLVDGVKIRVWQGFGAPQADPDGSLPPTSGGVNGAWTFSGQIDDVDTDAGDSTQGNPNQIVITARNGKLLTDQTLFEWVKSRQLPDPITFYDNASSDTTYFQGFRARASGYYGSWLPRNVVDLPTAIKNPADAAYQTKWRSGGEPDPYIEILVGQGRYEDLWLSINDAYKDVAFYISVYARDMVTYGAGTTFQPAPNVVPPERVAYTQSTLDGVSQPQGWISAPGAGAVPGSGIPSIGWVSRLGSTGGSQGTNLWKISLFHILQLGPRSVIRLTFVDHLPTIDGAQRMEVADFHALGRRTTQDSAIGKWITVNDASECVKVVLRWCGYTQWEVEDAGVRLNGRLIFNRTQAPMEVINNLAKQTGFVFFIADPTDGNSDGVPTFRKDSSLLTRNDYIAADFRDDANLTGIKRKSSDQDRAFLIRVRGTSVPASRDVPGRGVNMPWGGGFMSLGGDTIKRIMAVYFPPWVWPRRAVPGLRSDSWAGVRRSIVHQDDNIQTYAQCWMGCLLIALRCALAIHTLQITGPAHPILELDDQVTVLDEPSGTNSRMWVTQTEDTMSLGDQQTSGGSGGSGSWTLTAQGALIDTPEFQAVIAEANATDWKAIAGVNEDPLPGLTSTKTRPGRVR